jgi:hypothetical protein
MNRDPMAGAWIVQSVIVILVMLLIGTAIGLPILSWWGGISLAGGMVFAGAARCGWRLRNPPR